MRRVNYDAIAGEYARRYQLHDYGGVERLVLAFAAADSGVRTLEVGCGTGRWLALVSARGAEVMGLDPSRAMLEQARTYAAAAPVVQGRAEVLPVRAGTVDRVMCVNALHHFTDPVAFFAEARRILRPGGGLLTVGLDPHVGQDRWWIYDYFPEALTADLARYVPTASIRQLLAAAGFINTDTHEAQHMPAALPVPVAMERGLLDRSSTSQLMVISDDAYLAGMDRVRAIRPGSGDEEPMLRADLRLYATTGWLPAQTVPAI